LRRRNRGIDPDIPACRWCSRICDSEQGGHGHADRISRTTPTDKPAELLAEVATAGVGEQQIKRQSLIESSQDSATDGGRHLCHVATIEDQDGEHRVTRLRCSVYVHGDLMAHVVSIIGSTGADDQAGLDALTAMFDTLRIDQNPGYHQRDRGDERGASQ